MNIVLDANVLMSALIKDSLTREIIVKSRHDLWVPETVFSKLLKYRPLIVAKSGLSPEDLNSLINKLFEYISVFPPDKIKHREMAKKAMSADQEDAIFVACALSMPNSAIWSNDKHLKKQDLATVYTTEEFLRIL